ncbi:MAG TPA: OmpH family outer membrane protein [Humidesulfovibrio sp.]|uniref:OmpH family outer membrane protein n=1 Tax=Humidesulfovibrio sp. TaxID=2910988 RepID=UPI002B6CB994|nr:OmpH family outer membrane protein [Humidesulfovibrio sp.]HWR03757.1 OmpH family outer membrane protein [Humidesulfovibrio sp.]
MRKFLAAAFFLLLLQSVAFAAGPAKVGIFDPEEVLRASEPGQEAIKQFEAKMKPDSERIEKQQKDFLKMQEDFQKQAFALAPEARQDKERELRRKEFELSEAVRMFQNAANREKSIKLNEIFKVLNDAVTDYSSKNGYSLVMAKTQGIIYYFDPTTDITKAITAELNKAWKTRKK